MNYYSSEIKRAVEKIRHHRRRRTFDTGRVASRFCTIGAAFGPAIFLLITRLDNERRAIHEEMRSYTRRITQADQLHCRVCNVLIEGKI
jgi:hypothetical protein